MLLVEISLQIKSQEKIGQKFVWTEGTTNRTTDYRWFHPKLKTKIKPLLEVMQDTLLLGRNKYVKTYSHPQSCKHSKVCLLLVSWK